MSDKSLDLDYYENVILYKSFTDPRYLGSIIDYIQPRYFDNKNFKSIIALIKAFFIKRQSIPSATEIASYCTTPELKSNLNVVRSPSENFYSSDNQLVFLSGYFHPFVEMGLEGLEEKYSFKHVKGGLFWDTKNWKMKLSFGKRDDFRTTEETKIVSQTSELRIEQSNYSGWNGIIHLINRQVDSETENPNTDYVLGDVRIRYNRKSSSIKWEGFF